METCKISPNKLEKKIIDMYPNTFSEELKKGGGNYYPLNMRGITFTDQQIRDQIERKTFGFEYSINVVKIFLEGVRDHTLLNDYVGKHPDKKERIYRCLPYIYSSPIDHLIWLEEFEKEFEERPLRVIDLGCGFGVESLIMGELGNDVEIYALDKDPEKVSLFNSVLEHYTFEDGKQGKEKIIPVEGDVFDLPDFDKQFDGVFIKDVIGYLATFDVEYGGDVIEATRKAMKNTTQKVMEQVKKIAPNGWLTLLDRDTTESTRDAFVEGVIDILGSSGLPAEYEMLPVKMKFGDRVFDNQSVLLINRPVKGYETVYWLQDVRKNPFEETRRKEGEFLIFDPLF